MHALYGRCMGNGADLELVLCGQGAGMEAGWQEAGQCYGNVRSSLVVAFGVGGECEFL